MAADIKEITSILAMPKGAAITYHVGHITIDAAKQSVDGPNIMNRTAAEREAISDIRLLAQRFSDQGKVALVQRRLGEHSYEYIAQRTGR